MRVRGITDISREYVDVGREYVDLYAAFGYKLHDFDQYRGLFLLVMDGKESVSSINVALGVSRVMKILRCFGATIPPTLRILFLPLNCCGNKQFLQHSR